MPVVKVAGRRVVPGEPGHADALVSLIPSPVTATAEAERRGLRLELTAGAVDGPEIAVLSGFEDRRWTCWRPGEETFEHLT